MDIKDALTTLAVIALVGFCGYQWWPVKVTKYTCEGNYASASISGPDSTTVIFELTQYPWWLFWNASDGSIRADGGTWMQSYEPYVEKHGENFQIRSAQQGEYQGSFSSFNYRLELYFGEMRYNGMCAPLS